MITHPNRRPIVIKPDEAEKSQPLASSARSVRFQLFGSVVSVFTLTFVVCFLFSMLLGLPYPKIHDEYSYLLAGETFALGKMTNSTLPMFEHFEVMHVLQSPTYMSKYPPGQGLALATGYWMGHPIYGVWLSLACASAAMVWAMAAVVDLNWACTCGVLFMFSMNTASYDIMWQIGYWAQSYWGGAAACLGGALALGSVFWFGRLASTGTSVQQLNLLITVFVIGLWILAITRPLEGLLVSIPMSICLLNLWIKSNKYHSVYSTAKGLIVPLLVGFAGACWLGYYHASVTGSPFQLPYLCYEKQYSVTPMFLNQPLRQSRGYHNEAMRWFHEEWEAGVFLLQQNWNGYLFEKGEKLRILWKFFLGWCLTIPAVIGALASAVALLKNRRSNNSRLGWMGGAATGLIVLVHSHTVWINPHYMAPLVPFLWCWIGLGLATLSSWTLYRFEVGLLLSITCVGFAALLMWDEFETRLSQMANHNEWHLQRRDIESKLHSTDGRHLVLVEYDASHSPHEEWCYNSADIDRSKIVWARDLGPSKNERLMEYFSDRTIHRLFVSMGSATLDAIESRQATRVPIGFFSSQSSHPNWSDWQLRLRTNVEQLPSTVWLFHGWLFERYLTLQEQLRTTVLQCGTTSLRGEVNR